MLQRAKYLGVDPQKLLTEYPLFWYEWAGIALRAENLAQREANKPKK